MGIEQFRLMKNQEYMNYIDEHVTNVKAAYQEIKEKCDEIPWAHDAIKELDQTGVIERHDDSKYSDEEFYGYRVKFYPVDSSEKGPEIDELFEKAWEHHYRSNDHHWNFWVHDGVADDMSDTSIVHIIADWQGMSYKFGDNARIWFEKQTDIILSDYTKKKVEELLKTLCR